MNYYSDLLSVQKESFVYPTPFEPHFSVTHLDWYRKSSDDYIQKMKGTGKDLAAHFNVIRQRGLCLDGAPVSEVFGEVPERDYMDSIWNDIADAVESISDHIMYLILNLGRVLTFKEVELACPSTMRKGVDVPDGVRAELLHTLF